MPYTIIVDNYVPAYGYFENRQEAEEALVERGWRKIQLQKVDQFGRKNWRQPHEYGDFELPKKGGKSFTHAHIQSTRVRLDVSKLPA